MICFRDYLKLVSDVTIDNNTFIRQIESLQIIPILPENREDFFTANKESSISAKSKMNRVLAEIVSLIFSSPIFNKSLTLLNTSMYANMRLNCLGIRLATTSLIKSIQS